MGPREEVSKDYKRLMKGALKLYTSRGKQQGTLCFGLILGKRR